MGPTFRQILGKPRTVVGPVPGPMYVFVGRTDDQRRKNEQLAAVAGDLLVDRGVLAYGAPIAAAGKILFSQKIAALVDTQSAERGGHRYRIAGRLDPDLPTSD